ncbi:MAG: MurR/RpiR family transcriptional regulator [Oscillospiraceae bacterium]|nr:MurR/RpiR family transcriptional regulator [Oscillospiraceae bacterium]
MSKDILSVIAANAAHFSKGQKRIAAYISNSYDKAAFITANQLGQAVGVSESTVVRFAAELGYDGYPGMQRALQDMVRNKLTSIQRIEISNDRLGNQDILSQVIHSDVDRLRTTLEEVDRVSFEGAVDSIVKAKRIYILGVRSSSSIASFLGFYLNLMFDSVVLIHSNSVSEVFEQVFRISPEDVFIGISFPRYSNRTAKTMQFAHDRGATTIAITDNNGSPLSSFATYSLFAKSDMVSFLDSLVAPLSLVNALLAATAQKRMDKISRAFETLEQIWEEYEVYTKSETDKG